MPTVIKNAIPTLSEPQENVINTSCGHGVQNLSPPEASPLVWTVGCVQALASLLESNVVSVSCVISGIAVLQVNTLFVSFSFVAILSKNQVSPLN